MEDADSDSGIDSDGTLIQILVSILTAVGTTLGVTSCMGYGPML